MWEMVSSWNGKCTNAISWSLITFAKPVIMLISHYIWVICKICQNIGPSLQLRYLQKSVIVLDPRVTFKIIAKSVKIFPRNSSLPFPSLWSTPLLYQQDNQHSPFSSTTIFSQSSAFNDNNFSLCNLNLTKFA